MYDREKYERHKEAHRRSWTKRQQRNAKWTTEDKLSRGCSMCGYNRCARALHYHHHNDDKEVAVGRLVAQGASLERVMAEAAKCIILCANCHAETHSGIV